MSEEVEVTFRLFLSYWRPTRAPISPVSFSCLHYCRMSCAGVSSLSLALCVCLIVCVSQEALRGAGGGVEGVFHSSCTSAGCISLGVTQLLFDRERGISPISIFSKLSYFLPLIAHNKLPEANTYTHTLLSQEARQRFPATLERGRWGLIWPYLLTWLHSCCLSLVWTKVMPLFWPCLLCNLVQSVYSKLLIGS